MARKKVVLAYSGGLDTSVCVKWLQEKYDVDVITLTLDIGQPKDFAEVEKRAIQTGAIRHYTIDVKKEFIENYVFPAIKANALYEGKYPITASLSRPLIASKLVEVARKEGAVAVAHGCTGKGNDQVRFEVTIKSLAPDLEVIAPVREWGMTRDQEIEYALKHGIPVSPEKSPYSVDENLWGRSIECGVLEYPEVEPPEEVFEWTVPPEKAPDQPEYVEIEFFEGVPVTVNGEEMNGVSLIKKLNEVAGKHGVGRIDHMEDRLVGIKSREVYECPAATVLLEAHKDLEKAVLTRHEVMFKELIDAEWTRLVYYGLWTEPLRQDLEGFIEKTQKRVCGKVRVKLYKGGLRVVGRSSPYSLYDYNLATYEVSSTFDQSLAKGFIELWGLPTRVANEVMRKARSQPRP